MGAHLFMTYIPVQMDGWLLGVSNLNSFPYLSTSSSKRFPKTSWSTILIGDLIYLSNTIVQNGHLWGNLSKKGSSSMGEIIGRKHLMVNFGSLCFLVFSKVSQPLIDRYGGMHLPCSDTSGSSQARIFDFSHSQPASQFEQDTCDCPWSFLECATSGVETCRRGYGNDSRWAWIIRRSEEAASVRWGIRETREPQDQVMKIRIILLVCFFWFRIHLLHVTIMTSWPLKCRELC